MGNNKNLDVLKGKINPQVWLRMKASAICQGKKIHEWIEEAIIEKLNTEGKNEE